MKFSKKTFKAVLQENSELQEVFVKEAYNLLYTYLSDTKIKDSVVDNVKKNISSLFDKFSSTIVEEE